MRTPSTSDLCHSQANTAYNKLAVISENIEKLDEIYEFIFDYYEYLRSKLANYVDLSSDQTITGTKEFTKSISTPSIELIIDDYTKGGINITFEKENLNKPCLNVNMTRSWTEPDGEVQDKVIGAIKLSYDVENDIPLLEVVDTIGTAENSAVSVKFLKVQLDNLKEILEEQIKEIWDKVDSIVIDDTLTSDSNNPVTSKGIYTFIDNTISNLGLKDIKAKLEELGSNSIEDSIAGILKRLTILEDNSKGADGIVGTIKYAYYNPTGNTEVTAEDVTFTSTTPGTIPSEAYANKVDINEDVEGKYLYEELSEIKDITPSGINNYGPFYPLTYSQPLGGGTWRCIATTCLRTHTTMGSISEGSHPVTRMYVTIGLFQRIA